MVALEISATLARETEQEIKEQIRLHYLQMCWQWTCRQEHLQLWHNRENIKRQSWFCHPIRQNCNCCFYRKTDQPIYAKNATSELRCNCIHKRSPVYLRLLTAKMATIRIRTVCSFFLLFVNQILFSDFGGAHRYKATHRQTVQLHKVIVQAQRTHERTVC